MKKWIVIIFSISVLTGCFKLEQEITLNADGSGKVSILKAMTEEMIAEIDRISEEQRKMGARSGESNIVFDEAKLREFYQKYQDFGVTLRRLEIEKKNGWRYAYIDIEFENFLSLRKLADFKDISLRKNISGDYVISSDRSEELAGTDSDPEMLEKIKPMLPGFRVVAKVNTPADIISTNATISSERSAIWIIDYDEDPESINQLPLKPEVVFSGKDIDNLI